MIAPVFVGGVITIAVMLNVYRCVVLLGALFVTVFIKICFAGFTEFGVPCFTEAVGERALKELIQAYAELFSFLFRSLANVPAVIVYSGECRVFGEPYRIEGT